MELLRRLARVDWRSERGASREWVGKEVSDSKVERSVESNFFIASSVSSKTGEERSLSDNARE